MAGKVQHIQLSPNSLNFFLECKRCFWFEKRWGIKRPQPYPYELNTEVDALLKEEFDSYRKRDEVHPLIASNKIPARLFANQTLLNQWRSNLKGLRYYNAELDATLLGAPDDILEFKPNVLAPLDYKSTGSNVPKVYDRFQLQMDVYTYLLEKNGYKTPKKGYLAFYIVNKKDGFEDRLPFRKELHEIETNPGDVNRLFRAAVSVVRKNTPPEYNEDCQYCYWFKKTSTFRS